MSRCRLVPVVWEQDPASADMWVAPVPDGPLVRIGGIGTVVFELLLDDGGVGLEADEIAETIRRLDPSAPIDAEKQIRRFLAELTAHGIAEEVDR